MELFQTLGQRIEREWRDHHNDDLAFPRIAERALQEAALHERVTPPELVRWALSADRLPKQFNIDATFGEPPLTLYASRAFYIEALFWLEGTTSIHGHSFSGAFAVLAGSSIQSRYVFRPSRRVSSLMMIGDVELQEVELLRRGDVRPIQSKAGEVLIHSLFHLERPSVTIVARTVTDVEGQPQLRYLPPSLAIPSNYGDEAFTRRLQLLQMVAALEDAGFEPMLAEFLSGADYLTSVIALEYAARLHIGAGEALDPFIQIVRDRHGSLADPLPRVFANARRTEELVNLRNATKAPEHRFFLALLLNVPDRRSVLQLVRAKHPECNPVDTVLRWAREMTAGATEGENILEIDFDETSLAMLRGLLEGLGFEEIKARFAAEYSVEDVEAQAEALRRLYDDLRALDRLRPLFTE